MVIRKLCSCCFHISTAQGEKGLAVNVNSVGQINLCMHDLIRTFEPPHDKTNKINVRPAKTDQLGPPPSLIRAFAVRSVGS